MKKVLIIEPYENLRKIICLATKKFPELSIAIFEKEEDAVFFLNQNNDTNIIILTDSKMIERFFEFKIPILGMGYGDEKEWIKLGFDGFFPKPTEHNGADYWGDFVTKINFCISLKQTAESS